MRAMGILRKNLTEEVRDIWGLVLALTTAPFFVLLYWSFTGGGSTTYPVQVINLDQPVAVPGGPPLAAGDTALAVMREMKYPNGQPILSVEPVEDRAVAEERLRNRDAAALLVLPENLSRSLASPSPAGERARVTLVGDLSNPMYAVAGVITTAAVDELARTIAGRDQGPIELVEHALGGSAGRTEFEAYVPGLFIFAALMVLFSAAMAVAREVESGTLRRLQISRMTAFDFLAGITAAQVLISVSALALTMLVAWACGFRSMGPMWAALLIGAITAVGVVGVGLVVACFSRTVTRSFLVANVPFILLMFFSGAIYPFPKVELFEIGARTVGLWDILPPTHAVVALNKILSLGSGLSGVTYEVVSLLVLSVVYFGVGVLLMQRTHMRPA